MIDDLRPPYRIAFDNARDPYTARNALGIASTGGGGGAPIGAQYIVAAADPTLTAERVLTNTATITWDFSTPGQAKASTAAGGGNVSNSGTPTVGQYAKWVTATTIQGVAPATVLSDIGAQPAGSYQPFDADLTAIAALTGTNTIYYRSAADTWSPVTISTGLSFSGGALTCTVSTAGSQPLDATLTALAAYNTNGLVTQTAADTFTGRSIAVPAAGISITNANGVAGNPTLALADDLAALEALAGTNTIYYRSGTSAWTAVAIGTNLTFAGGTLAATVPAAFITAVTAPLSVTGTTLSIDLTAYSTTAQIAAAYQPLDADLTSLAAASATGAIYYRSAVNTWATVTVGAGLSFSGGNLTASGGGGDVFLAASNPFTGTLNTFVGADVVFGHTAALDLLARVEVHGTSNATAGASIARWSADAVGPELKLRKSRGAAAGTHTVVSSGDVLGRVSFSGSTGGTFQSGGPAVAGICNSSPFGTNTPGFIQIEATTIGGAVVTAATFKDTGCALLGAVDGSTGAASFVGEEIILRRDYSGRTVLVNAIFNVAGSIALAAGEWELSYIAGYHAEVDPSGGNLLYSSLSTTSTSPASSDDGYFAGPLFCSAQLFVAGLVTTACPPFTVRLTSSRTYYLLMYHTLNGSGSVPVYGTYFVRARRVR